MAVSVDFYSWPEIVLAPGQEATFIHWVVNGNGSSLIEPDRWYWMSSVPELTDVRPDRPVPAASLEIVAQGPVRDRASEPGPSRTNWMATWRNTNPEASATFHPRMVGVPAR